MEICIHIRSVFESVNYYSMKDGSFHPPHPEYSFVLYIFLLSVILDKVRTLRCSTNKNTIYLAVQFECSTHDIPQQTQTM